MPRGTLRTDRAATRDGVRHVGGPIGVEALDLAQQDWARAVAIIARATGDLSLAEDAVQDAIAAALERWPSSGVPQQPLAWIVAVAKNRAVDLIRRRRVGERAVAALAELTPTVQEDELPTLDVPIPDERLALIFACCHPALTIEAQVALTLRLVAGLHTDQVARAFMVPEATMGQRLSRAKQKVRDAGIPIQVPEGRDRVDRRDAVLAVVYLVFNAGYSDAADGLDTAREAIRLGEVLAELMPDDGEVHGLLALMRLHESRRQARTDAEGAIVLLADQDRSLWDRGLIVAGIGSLRRSLALGGAGQFQLQAAIAACHAVADREEVTDWRAIVALYGRLAAVNDSPVVELNRAVAMSLGGDPEGALQVLEDLADQLVDYPHWHVAMADSLRRLGRRAEARVRLLRAAELAASERERELFLGQAADLAF